MTLGGVLTSSFFHTRPCLCPHKQLKERIIFLFLFFSILNSLILSLPFPLLSLYFPHCSLIQSFLLFVLIQKVEQKHQGRV
jgi:hypothetical protein